jgi:DNA-binding transcriptional LysR family regulator
VRIRVSSFDALFRVIDARMGVGIVPLEIVRGRYGVDSLVTIPLDESWVRRELVMGVRDYKSLPPVTKLLVDHLRTHDDARLMTSGVSDRLTVAPGSG